MWEPQHPREVGYWHGYLEGLKGQPGDSREDDLGDENPTWGLLHDEAVRFWAQLGEASALEENK